MWKDIKIDKVDDVEKLVGEYIIWMHDILPYGKMKVHVYEGQDGKFTGNTDVRIISRIDNTPQGGLGFGIDIDAALEDTINNFLEIFNDNASEVQRKNGLAGNEIQYADSSDF